MMTLIVVCLVIAAILVMAYLLIIRKRKNDRERQRSISSATRYGNYTDTMSKETRSVLDAIESYGQRERTRRIESQRKDRKAQEPILRQLLKEDTDVDESTSTDRQGE
jgi:hypothetical protein